MARGIKTKVAELGTIKLPNGGTLRYDLAQPRFGWVTCPDCPEPKEERYVRVPPEGSKEFLEFTGLCLPCSVRRGWEYRRKRYPRAGIKYNYPTTDLTVSEYGSEVLWSKYGGGRYVSVRCGLCKREHRIVSSVAIQPKCTGVCKECYRRVLSLNKKFTHEEVLPKGTRVLWHTRLQGQRHKVGIECRGCFKETGQVKYVGDKQIQNHIKGNLYWDELCSDCVQKRGRSLRKFTAAQTAPSGTVTHFENVVDGKVLVVYRNPDKGCGCERWVDRDTASSWWKRFPAVCRFHHNHPESYVELLQARRTSGNKQGESKPSGRKRQDRSQWLLEAINAVAELWRRYESLPRQKRIDCITQEDLAPLLGFGGGDPTTIAKQVYNRLKDCGLREMFPGVRSWFNSFVETVGDEIERDTDPQTILARLMQRRDRTAA